MAEGHREASGSTGTMSIGEILAVLKPEFPDITVSKIRFLEGAGLVRPDRSPSGYRKFSEDDVARLRFVLRAQRDQYLPLRVIRQRLTDLEAVGGLHARGGPPMVDRGGPPSTVERGGPAAVERGPDATPAGAAPTLARPRAEPRRGQPARTGPAAASAAAPATAPPAGTGLLGAAGASDAQFTRDELCRAAGADPAQLAELESFGLLGARGSGERGTWYSGDDLVLLRLAGELAEFGLEARHLRMYKTFAEREAALFEQVVAPLVLQRNPEARGRARETLETLAELGGRLRDVALRNAISSFAEARDARR